MNIFTGLKQKKERFSEQTATKLDHHRNLSEANRNTAQIIAIQKSFDKGTNEYKLPYLKESLNESKAKNNIFAKAYESVDSKNIPFQER